MDDFLDLQQHEMITKFSGFSIKTVSDQTRKGELLDTKVYFQDPMHAENSVYICTIAGNTIGEFMAGINYIITKYRIWK